MEASVAPITETDPLDTDGLYVYPGDVFRMLHTDPSYFLTVTDITPSGLVVHDSATNELVPLSKHAPWRALEDADHGLAPHWLCIGRESTTVRTRSSREDWTLIVQAHFYQPAADASPTDCICFSYGVFPQESVSPPSVIPHTDFQSVETLTTALSDFRTEETLATLRELTAQHNRIETLLERLQETVAMVAPRRKRQTDALVARLNASNREPDRDWFDDCRQDIPPKLID